ENQLWLFGPDSFGVLQLSKEFLIHSDHEALKHLRGKGKLSRRHAKWHKLGKTNVVVNTFSRKYALIAMLETKMLGLNCMKRP
ncbi:hypothetical protein CR513_51915, partial [Mucuna pruriens]